MFLFKMMKKKLYLIATGENGKRDGPLIFLLFFFAYGGNLASHPLLKSENPTSWEKFGAAKRAPSWALEPMSTTNTPHTSLSLSSFLIKYQYSKSIYAFFNVF